MILQLNDRQVQTLINVLSECNRQEVKDLVSELRHQIPMTDFYEKVQELKALEYSELKRILKLFGTPTKTGYVREFSDSEYPVIAGYGDFEPCDIKVCTVKVDNDNLIIIGEYNNDKGYKFTVNLENIFAGQLEHVIKAV